MNQRWILATLYKDCFGVLENLGSVLAPHLVLRCTCRREEDAKDMINRLNGLVPPQPARRD